MTKHMQRKVFVPGTELVVSGKCLFPTGVCTSVSASGWVCLCVLQVCECVGGGIRYASVLERLMKSSPKVRCHAVSTAVVQEQRLTSESPPWKPIRNPKEENRGQPKKEYC